MDSFWRHDKVPAEEKTFSDARAAAAEAFEREFGEHPAHLIFAPGRVNLIGEHTDYNDGYVLPLALHAGTWIALRPRPDRRVRIRSLNVEDEGEFDLDELSPGRGWLEYVKGVMWVLQSERLAGRKLKLTGWEGIIAGSVPVASGLSSSGSLEVAVLRAALAAAGEQLDIEVIARLGQLAENDWVGMTCGIMDQFTAAAATPGELLFLDSRSLEHEVITLPGALAVVILDTGVRRGLLDTAYIERRRTCEAAARALGIDSLRDADLAMLESRENELTLIQRKRARHVLRENQRVLEMVEALRSGSFATTGELMNASHIDLRDNFEVTISELDAAAEIAASHPDCWGARMTGAGFGGSVVALVNREGAEEFAEEVSFRYRDRMGRNLSPLLHGFTD